MADEITHDDIDRQFYLLRTEPQKFLTLTNEFVKQRPRDAGAYFVRHQAWSEVGQPELALADLEKSLELEDRPAPYEARGRLLQDLGRYQEAIEAYDHCERLDPAQWQGGFGPLFRADCHYRLGNEAAALADCDTLPNDHWTPGLLGAPAGTKSEVAKELRRRATAAQGNR
jgi:tetratricopeptide (TPR) repeat protein